jgi:hypothetical protein
MRAMLARASHQYELPIANIWCSGSALLKSTSKYRRNLSNRLTMSDKRHEPTLCPHCRQPMKLVHTIPPLEGFSEISAFYCRPCQHAETKNDGSSGLALPCWDHTGVRLGCHDFSFSRGCVTLSLNLPRWSSGCADFGRDFSPAHFSVRLSSSHGSSHGGKHAYTPDDELGGNAHNRSWV